MAEALFALFKAYGHGLVLVGVFLDVAGLVPIPGEIYLLMAGALAWTGDLDLRLVVLLGTFGAFLGDHATFYIGRRGGKRLIDLYCKYTLCSAQCSLNTVRFFSRFGGLTLIFSRFLIGVRTLACPLAGASGMRYRRFAGSDLMGALLWAASFTSVGFLFSRQLRELVRWVEGIAHGFVPLLFFVIAFFIGYRSYRRWRYGPAEAVLSVAEAERALSEPSVSEG